VNSYSSNQKREPPQESQQKRPEGQLSNRPLLPTDGPKDKKQFTLQCAVSETPKKIKEQVDSGARYQDKIFLGGGEVLLVFEK
jgi:hypothetical protein